MMNRSHTPSRRQAAPDRPRALRPGTAAIATTAPQRSSASVRAGLSLALVYERLAITLYYTALTTPAVMRDRRLAGRSGDPRNPGLPPGGNPANVHIVQAALDAEVKHAAALARAGAASRVAHFHFPAATFRRLGSVHDTRTFLGVVQASETACVGLYLALLNHLFQLRQLDLASFVVQVMGVEAEHRMLSRVIADVDPANNLIVEDAPYAALSAAETTLRPFLTGKGFPGGATRAIALPTAAQTARVIGRYGTHIVTRFL